MLAENQVVRNCWFINYLLHFTNSSLFHKYIKTYTIILHLGSTKKSAHPAHSRTTWSCPPFSARCIPWIRSCPNLHLWGGTCEHINPTLFVCRFQLPRFQLCLFENSIIRNRLFSIRTCRFPSALWSITPLIDRTGISKCAWAQTLEFAISWILTSFPSTELTN